MEYYKTEQTETLIYKITEAMLNSPLGTSVSLQGPHQVGKTVLGQEIKNKLIALEVPVYYYRIGTKYDVRKIPWDIQPIPDESYIIIDSHKFIRSIDLINYHDVLKSRNKTALWIGNFYEHPLFDPFIDITFSYARWSDEEIKTFWPGGWKDEYEPLLKYVEGIPRHAVSMSKSLDNYINKFNSAPDHTLESVLDNWKMSKLQLEDIDWTTFTRRTNDPKLSFIEDMLTANNIKHRRQGQSFHAPILQVPKADVVKAWEILTPELDDMPDDDVRFMTAIFSEALARQSGQ